MKLGHPPDLEERRVWGLTCSSHPERETLQRSEAWFKCGSEIPKSSLAKSSTLKRRYWNLSESGRLSRAEARSQERDPKLAPRL